MHLWTHVVGMLLYFRAHKPRCPPFPLPSPSQLSPSIITPSLHPVAPSLLSLAKPSAACGGSGLPHHACANWGLMRGICFPFCAYGSPAGVLARSPLSVSLGCSRRRADASLLPCREQLATITAMSWTAVCFVTPTQDAWSPLPGSCFAGRVLCCNRSHQFLSENKNKQLSPSRCLNRISPGADSMYIEKCTQVSGRLL